MKTLLKDLKKEYKPYKSIYYTYSHQQYQKKVTDEKGIKYFINCALYDYCWVNHFEFDAHFTVNDRSISLKTVSRTNDPEEKRWKYPKIKEIEEMFEKMRVAYGSWYYELYYS